MKSSSESQSGRTGDSTQFSAIDSQSKPDFFITFADAANSLDDIQAIKQLMLSFLIWVAANACSTLAAVPAMTYVNSLN